MILSILFGGNALAEKKLTGLWVGLFGVMTLEQDDHHVFGTYSIPAEGLILGTVEGDSIHITFRDSKNGQGTGVIQLQSS